MEMARRARSRTQRSLAMAIALHKRVQVLFVEKEREKRHSKECGEGVCLRGLNGLVRLV